MIYLWTGVCLLCLILFYIIYRDLAAPPILSALIWLIVYIIIIQSKTNFINNKYIGCFAISLVFFSIGFLILVPSRIKPIDDESYSVRIKPNLSKPIIIFEYVATIIYVLIYKNDIINRTASIWSSIRNSEIETNYMLGVLVNAFPIISAVSLYVYFKNPEKRNRNYFLLTLPPLLLAMLTSNRTTWFYVISTFIFVIIFTKQLKNKTIVKLAVAGGLIVSILFVVSTLAKFSNMMITATNTEKVLYYVDVYFASPPLAFLQWLDNNHLFQYGYGKYTFRFVLALLHVFNPSLEVPKTVLEFTIVDGMSTNVYTILHWYAMDGGLVWAYFIQFFIGIMFGLLYRKVRATNNPDRFFVVLLSMMMSIILGQFFCDQLATHVSAWIQRIFWCYFCCNILVQNISLNQVVLPRKRLFYVPKIKIKVRNY